MITVEKCTDYDIIKSIFKDPKLHAVLGDGVHLKDIKVREDYDYLLIRNVEGILGCWQIRQMTNTTLECHINILSQFWGKEVSILAAVEALRWVKDNTRYTKLFTDVPSVCKQVLGLCDKFGWKVCGLLKDGTNYNGQIVDVILLDYDIKRGVK